jgi:hypothetical protein
MIQFSSSHSPDDCHCGSGKSSWQLFDAAGIYCNKVCDDCVAKAKSKYRSEIFEDSAYDSDEPKEPDE